MASVRIFQSSKDYRVSFYVLPHGDDGSAELVLEYSGKDPVRIPIPMTPQDVLDMKAELERIKPAGKGGHDGSW